MSNFEKLRQLEMDLGRYAELEGCELGEYCESLIQLTNYSYCYRSDGFEDALIAELETQLANFTENATIVTRTYEPQPPRTYEELEWTNE